MIKRHLFVYIGYIYKGQLIGSYEEVYLTNGYIDILPFSLNLTIIINLFGGRSSVGRAPDCDSGGRGFKPHRSPHLYTL